ncbi:hypothetical protein [Pediococcus pentosaceus]|uniref:hypothetical protein n=1 Tax=Pediococcus pentosaceus TaxID=1255 RepID=UPI001F55E0D2|nr:hypothetical protein [Pediococcus pentosaceus]MCI2960522.1 hypothetical protein [Pediococcus pentosaceus]
MKPIMVFSTLSSVIISCLLAKRIYTNQQYKGINSTKKIHRYDISTIRQINIYFERGKGIIEQIQGENLELEYYFSNVSQEKSFVYTENN